MDGKGYLNIKEVRAFTGLSDSTIRRRIADGSIQSWQPGGFGTKLLISIDSLKHTITPPAAVSANAPPPAGPQRRPPRWMQKLAPHRR